LLAVLAIAAIVVGLITLGGGGGQTPVGNAVLLTGAGSYDPYGPDKTEHSDQASSTVDRNAATYWSTEDYRDFEDTKPGVGVVLDAHGPVDLTRVTVASDTPGFTAEIEATNVLGGVPHPVSDKQTVGRLTAFDIHADAPARYYLVWITKMPLGRGSAHVNEVRAFEK
jgi:hypothetical protein